MKYDLQLLFPTILIKIVIQATPLVVPDLNRNPCDNYHPIFFSPLEKVLCYGRRLTFGLTLLLMTFVGKCPRAILTASCATLVRTRISEASE